MGRLRQFDEDQVLDRCLKLFARQGYRGTSLDDLVEVSGITKASLYHAFESKKSLYLRCLQNFEEGPAALQIGRLRDPSTPPLLAIESFLKSIFGSCDPKDRVAGCYLLNTLIEVTALGDPDLFEAANRPMRFIESSMESRLAEIFANGRVLAHFIMSQIQGLRIMAKRGDSKEDLFAMIDLLLLTLPKMAFVN